MPSTSPSTQEPPSSSSSSSLPSSLQESILPSQNPETSQPSQLRRPRPSHVQTENLIGQTQTTTAPHSAFTNSSMASSPQQVSPVCSPESEVLTTNSSIQPSPEPIRGRESEASPLPSSIEPLPEPIISRKTSTNSLPQSVSSERSTEPAPPKLNIIRRISTRVKTESSRLRGNRRTSSTHPVSRDASVGPAVLRRGRSDSSATAPPEYAVAIGSESDDEAVVAKEQQVSYPVPIAEGEALRDFSPASGAASIAASSRSSDIHTGPVIPQTLLQGMMISKVSTKRRKRLNLVLDSEAGKVFWDKNRPSKCVYIDDIKEIRVSPEIRQYRLDCGAAEVEETRFFSILYAVPDKKQKIMHLIADDDDSFQAWVTTLDALAKHRQALMSSLMSFNDRAIRIYWRKEMARLYSESRPVDEQIDFAGVERVCRNLHIHISQESLKARFDEADRTQTGHLNFDEFQDFVRLTARRGDVRAVYREIAADPEGGLTYEDFVRFLKEVQNENVNDTASWEAVFKQFSRCGKSVEPNPAGGSSEQPRMSESALAKYLTSIHNTPLEAVPKDCGLDRPINEYFISSSHNTYLIGRQVGDVSSIEGYISALMRGCRCVEVDCWDGPDNQPIVTHGKTLTSQIQFREVIGAINKYAFVKSAYPLWISLEVHCNAIQQEVMANIMKDIFGEKLVTDKLEGYEDRLPTPEQLKGRILVKCKTPNFGEAKSADTNGNGRRRGNSLTSPFSRPAAVAEPAIPNSPLLDPTPPGAQRGSSRRVNTITEGEISDVRENLSSSSSDDSGVEKTRRSKQSKITKVLGDLGVYCLGIKFRGFDDADCKIFNHILSFKEGTFLNNSSTKASKGALFRHNMRYLMRVYPGQYRFTSNNFDPLIYWRRGVQMAALNWQTFDLGMQFNQAMFAGGKDASGYVLKPRAFREIEMVPNSLRGFQTTPSYPEELNNKRERKNVTFTIDIISAQQLMRPFNLGERRTVNPYVEVEVFLADDKRDKQEANGQPLRGPLRYRTKIIKENGFNPVFDNTFTFNVRTKYPDLVFIRWSVKLSEGGNYNDRSPAVATYTAKLTSLKQGYRTLPLLDYNGDRYLFSTLFCRIKVDPITSVFVDYDAELENSNKLKSLGRTVFNRNAGQSPKSSFEKDSGFAP